MHPMNVSPVSVSKIFGLQAVQYREDIPLPDVIPANSEKLCKVAISNLGHFLLERITGSFTSTVLNGGNVVDDGICRLTAKFVDGSNQRQLFSDYVPLDVILSPGRVRSSAATNNLTTAPAPNSLFFPFEFRYLFAINSEIQVYVKNTSDVDQSIRLSFVGWRVRPSEATK